MWQDRIRTYYHQFLLTLRKHREAVDFTYQHRIWEGFWRYGWVGKLLLIVAALAGLKFLSIFLKWFFKDGSADPLNAISRMGVLVTDIASEGYQLFFVGGMKYALIVLLEIVIFHVCRRTTSLLTGRAESATFDAFLHAQFRMIKIAVRSWVLESVATMLIKLFFDIFGLVDFLEPVAIFAVQCFYLGFAVLDNYHEQFGLSIKDSARHARGFVGVALAAGLFLQIAFAVPVAGAIAGPVIATVAVTLTMFELSDLHERAEPEPQAEGEELV
jgi:CysZ protein